MSLSGIAPDPEGCSRHHLILPQGLAPVSDVFPVGDQLHQLEIGLQAIKLFAVSRGSDRLLAPYAWARQTAQWHAIVPFPFRVQVSHWTQGYHLQSLPTAWGICQSASWRRVVLVQLAQEPPAVYVEAGLQLAVGEPCRLFPGEEAYDSVVELVGGRERVRLVVVGRGARLFTSSLRPVSPSFSRRARASR